MATRKEAQSGAYRVLRDFGDHAAGDRVDYPDDEAGLLIRDGMITPAEGES